MYYKILFFSYWVHLIEVICAQEDMTRRRKLPGPMILLLSSTGDNLLLPIFRYCISSTFFTIPAYITQ